MNDWGEPLPPSFFDVDAHDLAIMLLGQVLVSEVGGVTTAGRLVELEVYGGTDDPACHADRGTPTARTASMFGAPGTAYVYRIYGMYDCLNVVAPRGAQGKAAAILVRAVEPLLGEAAMSERRGGKTGRQLTTGPGKLSEALGLSRALDGHPLHESPLRIHRADAVPRYEIETTPRIGLNPKTCGDSTQFPWRYVVRGSGWLSR